MHSGLRPNDRANGTVPQASNEFPRSFEPLATPQTALPSPGEIYKAVAPSVVAMKVNKEEERGPGHGSMDLDDELPSYGSGFVYDPERKIIVTNWHVAEVQEQLLVEIGEDTFPAKVLGVDPRLDLAVLQVETDRPLPPAVRLGDPSGSRVGDRVYTIGSPFGFDGTFGQGMISGPTRTMDGPGGVMIGLVQHNAVTNPGNSGGVLLNERGEVIAMNTMILSKSGGHQGFALSVPADLIKRSVDRILSGEKIEEPSLGLTLAQTAQGLAVVHVADGSVADRAGISSEVRFRRSFLGPEKPDFADTLFVTHVNGRKATRDSDLYAAIARNSAEPVRLSLRLGEDGKAFTLDLQPDHRPVPDMVEIRKIMKNYSPAGPGCEHIKFLSELEPTRPGDVPKLLHDAPFTVIFGKPEGGVLSRLLMMGSRREPSIPVDIYVNRQEALAVLLEGGKGFQWLERELDKMGFEHERSGDILHFSNRAGMRELPFFTAALGMLSHGQAPTGLSMAGLLGGEQWMTEDE